MSVDNTDALGAAAHLFRRHETWSAQGMAGLGHRRTLRQGTRQPKVRNVGMIGAIDDDVRRLEVAVENASFVGVLHGPGDLAQKKRRPPRPEGSCPRYRIEALANDQIHREVVLTLALAHFVDAYDIGVPQARAIAGFSAKPLHVGSGRERTVEHQLDGDLPGSGSAVSRGKPRPFLPGLFPQEARSRRTCGWIPGTRACPEAVPAPRRTQSGPGIGGTTRPRRCRQARSRTGYTCRPRTFVSSASIY